MGKREEIAKSAVISLPKWEALEGVYYKHDYNILWSEYADAPIGEKLGLIRYWVLHDLFFVLYFVMQWGEEKNLIKVNRKFVVDRCYEVEDGPEHLTLDLWARYHFKSRIRTARGIQRILRFPDRCSMIGSFSRPAAKKHMREIKALFEVSTLLKMCFPDVLYENPVNEAPKWSEDDGIIVRRKTVRRESTLEAHGLIEGMPTGSHFDYIDVDDLETKDTVKNPEVTMSVNEGFDTFFDLLTEDGCISVWGTTWSHAGTYVPFLTDKEWPDGRKVFTLRKYPATDDGTLSGTPVLISAEKWAEIRATKSEYTINCQQLLNPTPTGGQRLNSRGLQGIDPAFIPKDVLRFIICDPAGDLAAGKKKGNAWAIMKVAVERKADDWGASKCFIEDLFLKASSNTEATEAAVRMYTAGGVVHKVALEKTAQSTFDIHLKNALAAHGRYISEDNKTLVLLSPKGQGLEQRVLDALELPLNNSKWYINNAIPSEYRNRLYMELDKFPYFHPDGLVVMAYLYDILKDFSFISNGPRKVVMPTHRWAVV